MYPASRHENAPRPSSSGLNIPDHSTQAAISSAAKIRYARSAPAPAGAAAYGDGIVVGYDGAPVKVLQVHAYAEDPETEFLTIRFEGGARVRSVRAADGRKVVELADDVLLQQLVVEHLGDERRVEPGEGGAKVVALAEDRQPAQPGLGAFQGQVFEQHPVIVDGHAPLLVVVSDV